MASLLKKGGDNLLNGVILGAVAGVLIASSNLSFIQAIVTPVMSAVERYVTWAGTYKEELVFGLIGALVGYFLDRV